MRFATVDDRLVLVAGERLVDIAEASQQRFGPDPAAAFDRWAELTDWAATVPGDRPASTGPGATDPARFGPPVPRPRQVFAVALNYPAHAAEANVEATGDLRVFTKFPSCLAGPAATVALPSDQVDWEVELVVAIGQGGHRVPAEKGWSHVAGLTIGQDLSERQVQFAGSRPQFSLGKSFPGFGPTGPVLVTPDELDHPDDLEISCALDGTVVQHARTAEMIFPVPELIARISAVCPLLPGDLIFTGTPAGVGLGRKPPRYLRPTETLVSRIEGIGEIRTTFRATNPHQSSGG